jgi:hypothetical protein
MGVETSVERREKFNIFNNVETDAGGQLATRYWCKTGACTTRADKARFAQTIAEREESVWIKDDTWLALIGWPDFYPFYTLNSIISLQIIFLFFYFYTKIHDFFSSINRDLVH